MARSLVIVESPAKAKTINKYLGSDYIVKSSVGHIRDLPTGARAADPKARAKEAQKTKALPPEERAAYKKQRAREQLVRRMGINPDKSWSAEYEILPGKEKVVDELRRLAKNAPTVYLATDLDREMPCFNCTAYFSSLDIFSISGVGTFVVPKGLISVIPQACITFTS